MQYEAIRDERRMAANTATRIGDAFLSLLSFGQSFLDVFLRKDVDDTAKGRITFNNGAPDFVTFSKYVCKCLIISGCFCCLGRRAKSRVK